MPQETWETAVAWGAFWIGTLATSYLWGRWTALRQWRKSDELRRMVAPRGTRLKRIKVRNR